MLWSRRAWPRSPGGWGPSGRWLSTAIGVDELPLDESGTILDVTPTGIGAGQSTGPRSSASGLCPGPNAELAGGCARRERRAGRGGARWEAGPYRDVTRPERRRRFVAAGRVGVPRGGRRSGPSHDRRRVSSGPARAAAGRPSGRRGGGRDRRGSTLMSVSPIAPRTPQIPSGRSRWAPRHGQRDRRAAGRGHRSRAGGADRVRACPSGRRGTRPASDRRAARPSGSPSHRRDQAAVAIGGRHRRTGRGPGRAGPRLRAWSERARSPSCASRTGSAGPSTTCDGCARP